MPKISIVMPVYNGEKYLKEAIDSIVNQKYQDWELILVNDCSTDNSKSIMEMYAANDKRIQVINNEINQKLPNSLNIGFDNAKGDYYTWTSDDNRYKPQALYEMISYLENNSMVDLVYCDMDYIDESGSKIGTVSRDIEEIYYNNCIGACFMYRSEAAKKVGKYAAEMFLVEDYEYWLRFAKNYNLTHLPVCLYEYRQHALSLTETKSEKINRQLYKLRRRELDFILARIDDKRKENLFIDMWMQDKSQKSYLVQKFFRESGIPKELHWIEREQHMDESKKIILFGAGDFGKKALEYFGNERVAFYVDNNADIIGKKINGKEVISFDRLKTIYKKYQIFISVDARKTSMLARQLEDNGITVYGTYLEQVNNFKRTSSGEQIPWLTACAKAKEWIQKYTISEKGIANNSNLLESYPEVTGYYIPTLMRWGFFDLAISYAKWLCSIQHADGAWYDTEGKDPYVFDTAQILKGLLAVRGRMEGVDETIRRGCDWIISNIEENGRVNTPSKNEWGEEGICSELIHLYCLSPLIEAADILKDEKYRIMAIKAADYYINNHGDKIRKFSFLSHFYAYVMEALCDIGREEIAREAMKPMEVFIDQQGYVPAYANVNWVCSTGMFQLAIVWFKLGNLSYGNKALNYAASLQNQSGGWYGSYPVIDSPKVTDIKEYPDYFANSEISWAVKYFLDAVYFKNKLEFENQAAIFQDTIAENDGRYQIVLKEVKDENIKKICDVGCGKGRYLKNLLKDVPVAQYCAVDMSERVMKDIKSPIEKKVGLLTQIPYEDGVFDMVYTVEALEHSIFPENALLELIRVVRVGGKVLVIDKNKSAMGLLEIDEWEQWFENELFERIAEKTNCSLQIIENVPYEGGITDGLFNAWILTKN